MSRRKKNQSLSKAKEFADYLLWEMTSGNMGTAPSTKGKNSTATLGEKRGLLDSLLKIAALEKSDEDEEETSGFDKIRRDLDRKNKLNARGEIAGGGSEESPTDDPGADDASEG